MKKITVVCLALCSFLFGGDLFSVKAQILEKFTLPTPWTEEALKAEIPFCLLYTSPSPRDCS